MMWPTWRWKSRDERPWLLLDIDGVLNPQRGFTGPRRERYTPLGSLVIREDLVPVLHQAHQATRLAICSSWGVDANRYLTPLLDLPALPVIEMAPGSDAMIAKKVRGVAAWSKTKAARAGGVWIDDEVESGATFGPIGTHRTYGNVGLLPDVLAAILRDLATRPVATSRAHGASA